MKNRVVVRHPFMKVKRIHGDVSLAQTHTWLVGGNANRSVILFHILLCGTSVLQTEWVRAGFGSPS